MIDIATTETFGARLRTARIKAKLPQDLLGLELCVSKSAVSAWETGRQTPSFELLPSLSATLKISLDELVLGRSATSGSPTQISEPPHPYITESAANDPAEAELLRRYRALTKTKRSAVLELIRKD